MAPQLAIYSFVDTMEPRFNEPLFNEDLGIFLFNTRYHKLVSFEFPSCINKNCMYGILCPSDSKINVWKKTPMSRNLVVANTFCSSLALRCIEVPLSLSTGAVHMMCSC